MLAVTQWICLPDLSYQMNPAHCHKDGQSCSSLPSLVSSLAWCWLTVAAGLANRKRKENMRGIGEVAVKFQSNSPDPKAHWRHGLTTDWKLHFLFLWRWRRGYPPPPPKKTNKTKFSHSPHASPQVDTEALTMCRNPHTQNLFKMCTESAATYPSSSVSSPPKTRICSVRS